MATTVPSGSLGATYPHEPTLDAESSTAYGDARQFETVRYGRILRDLDAYLRPLLDVTDAELASLVELTETLIPRDAYRALRLVRGGA